MVHDMMRVGTQVGSASTGINAVQLTMLDNEGAKERKGGWEGWEGWTVRPYSVRYGCHVTDWLQKGSGDY